MAQDRYGSKTCDSWAGRAGGELQASASKRSGPETKLTGVSSPIQEGDSPRAAFRKAMTGR